VEWSCFIPYLYTEELAKALKQHGITAKNSADDVKM